MAAKAKKTARNTTKAKSNVEAPSKPGVIATLVTLLTEEGGGTVDQLVVVAKLAKRFPERKADRANSGLPAGQRKAARAR